MFVNIFLLLIFLICLAYLAAGLRRMESDLAEGRREMERLTLQQSALTGEIATLQEMVTAETARVDAAAAELEALKAQKEEAELQLQSALEAPKQRLFIFNKTTLIHGKLWAVKVTLMPTGGMEELATASEWAAGRICLVGSATERDARHRTESRFPSSQGYRIISIERFRRG